MDNPTQQALRFWSRVDQTGECWLWLGPTNRNGYGRTMHRDHRIMAHRAAYMLAVGPIPDGLDLDHLCRVRHCVNPAHLEPVTHNVNVLRGEGLAAVNAKRTACVHGHEFTDMNTYTTPDGRRQCRACIADRNAKSDARKREAGG